MNAFGTSARYYDSVYAERDYHDEAIHISSYLNNGELVDIGSGSGKLALEFQKLGYAITAIEPSHQMNIMAKHRGILAIEQKVDQMELYNKDNVVASFDVLDYVVPPNEYNRAIKKINKALKMGGIFYYEGWNKDGMIYVYEPTRWKEFIYDGQRGIRISTTTINRNCFFIQYNFYINGSQHEEHHVLRPRLGFENDFTGYGFTTVHSEIDKYSVRLWMRKVKNVIL